MKKVLPSLFLCIYLTCFTALAFAEIDKAASTEYIQISSNYTHIIEKTAASDYVLTINFSRNRSNLGLAGMKQTYNFVLAVGNYESSLKPRMVFNFQRPVKIELVNSNLAKTLVLPKKRSQVWSAGVSHEPDKKMREEIVAAQRIIFLIPCEDGSEKRIELPGKIVAEWQYIIRADMDDEQEALMGE